MRTNEPKQRTDTYENVFFGLRRLKEYACQFSCKCAELYSERSDYISLSRSLSFLLQERGNDPYQLWQYPKLASAPPLMYRKGLLLTNTFYPPPSRNTHLKNRIFDTATVQRYLQYERLLMSFQYLYFIEIIRFCDDRNGTTKM